MGQLMNIVMPILLLGGAVIVYSKRCELLGMCSGDSDGAVDEETTTTSEGGETPSAEEIVKDVNSKVPSAEEIKKDVDKKTPSAEDINKKVADIVSKSGSSSSNCCICRKESNGDVRCQRHGKGNWTRYKSAKQDMGRAMEICAKGCGGGNNSNYTRRSYFVDPNYIRPFTLYHRIGNLR